MSVQLLYLLRHGGAGASIMDDPVPVINPAEFGSYKNCLAKRVDGIRATRGMIRAENTERFVKIDEGEDGGEEPLVIDKAGNFVILSTSSLRELQTGLWGASAWKEMYEAAVFTANKADAATHARGV